MMRMCADETELERRDRGFLPCHALFPRQASVALFDLFLREFRFRIVPVLDFRPPRAIPVVFLPSDQAVILAVGTPDPRTALAVPVQLLDLFDIGESVLWPRRPRVLDHLVGILFVFVRCFVALLRFWFGRRRRLECGIVELVDRVVHAGRMIEFSDLLLVDASTEEQAVREFARLRVEI